MKLRHRIKKALPDFIQSEINLFRESKGLKEFRSLEKRTCNTENLREFNSLSLSDVFNSNTTHTQWKKSKSKIDSFEIPDGTGGVNPGDRKALYYLINEFKPKTVLEVGTHIGASTIHIATAFSENGQTDYDESHLITVDIRDVNCKTEKPWSEHGMDISPIDMVNSLNLGKSVSFVASNSIGFLKDCRKNFDFIFLDGDHSAPSVYQEVPLALKLLNKNGILLLHDYFPGGKPLWDQGTFISGPYLAIKRLIDEGANLVVLPLGHLPWATKIDSNITSLALLMRKDQKN